MIFDLWKKARLRILEMKIFSVFRRLRECLVKLLKIVIVLYVGINCHVQEKGKDLFHNGSPKDSSG